MAIVCSRDASIEQREIYKYKERLLFNGDRDYTVIMVILPKLLYCLVLVRINGGVVVREAWEEAVAE